MKMIAKPWEPQDLLDDLQEIIDQEADTYTNTRRTTLCMARDYLKEYFQQNGWVSVKDSLPDEDILVLLMCKNGAMFVGYCVEKAPYEEERRWRIKTALNSTKLLNKGRVIYWRPLPSAPVGGEHGK